MYDGFSIINLYPCGEENYQLGYNAYVQYLLPLFLQIPLNSKIV